MSKSRVRNYKDEDLISRVEGLDSFEGWKKGVYDIWIASNEDEYNKFDDKVYTFECYKDGEKPKFIMVCSGTTNAGSQGLKNFEGWNKLGCAVALRNYIGYNTYVYGPHGKTGYMAYVQAYSGKQYPYTRDNDKDNKAENFGKIYWDRIGMNCHKAGENSEDINGNSIACLVRNVRKQFDAWMVFMKKRPLSVVVLEEF